MCVGEREGEKEREKREMTCNIDPGKLSSEI